ncbi:hypothetical protein [Marinoscillum sp.]|uniref:hypothetical protein n=1 Tax=Marinoscillum sp. TaxID=2024838 RepID=UPI003BAC4F62
MQFIWYNPDLNAYQKGTMNEYDELVKSSSNGDRFDILYEFPEESDKLIDKILNSLNTVREFGMAG